MLDIHDNELLNSSKLSRFETVKTEAINTKISITGISIISVIF